MPPASPRASIIASPACLPPPWLSVAMCETTLTPGARQAMSAVKTGIPAAFASSMTGPIDLESHGQSTMAATFLTMKSFT